MWAPAVNVMLGCWLLASPFIFGSPDLAGGHLAHDAVSGLLVITLALASAWRPLRLAALGVAVLGLWLAASAYLGYDHPRPPAAQNHIILGLLLVMFGVIPPDASSPPRAWTE